MQVLPTKTQKIIDAYLQLDFGDGRRIPCPYFINRPPRRRGSLAVLVGKGRPDEIIEEVFAIARRKRMDVCAMDADDIRRYMLEWGIGIDCSGFVSRVLAEMVCETHAESLFRSLKPPSGLFRRIAFRLNPAKNISVADLASDQNSIVVANVFDARVGDMIVTKSGKHILVVSRVNYGEKGYGMLTYVQSKEQGYVSEGHIILSAPERHLADQNWQKPEDCVPEIEHRRLRVLS